MRQKSLSFEAKAIKDAMEQSGLGPSDFESRTNFSIHVWSNLITGRTKVRPFHLQSVRDVLGFTEDWPNSKPVYNIPTNAAPRSIVSLLNGDRAILPLYPGAIAGADDEFYFSEDYAESMEIPLAFLGAPEEVVRNLDKYFLVRASGMSMVPRIQPGEIVAVKRDPAPPANILVAAQHPEGNRFLKVHRIDGREAFLESINGTYGNIKPLDGWTFVGGIVCIFNPVGGQGKNVETNWGTYLRA